MNRGLDLSIRVMRNHQPEGKISRSRWYDILKRDTLSAARFFSLSLSFDGAENGVATHCGGRQVTSPTVSRPANAWTWMGIRYIHHPRIHKNGSNILEWSNQKREPRKREPPCRLRSYLFSLFYVPLRSRPDDARAPRPFSSLFLKKKKRKKEKSPNSSSFLSSFLYIFIHIPFFSLSLSLLLFSPSCNSSTREVARPPFVTLLDSHRFHLNFKGASSRVTIEMLFTHRDENRPPLMDL